jgi:putative peptidoglycan lipid II flippase
MGVKLKPNFNFNHPGIKKIGILMLPAVFGAAVYQINIFIGTLLASFLPVGSVSYLYYADRLVQLPLGVFAIAIGTAALPSFSDHVAEGRFDELKTTISFSMKLILFVTIPAMIALIVLRIPIISVLFQRGAFDVIKTIRTSEALLFYAVGLWAFSLVKVIVSAFYSLQDTKTPVKIAVVALVVNIIAGVILMFPMKHSGLALATSIASAVNVIMLFVILEGKVGKFLKRDFYISVSKTVLSSLIMGVAIIAVTYSLHWNNQGPFHERLFILIISIVVGIVIFITSSYLLKSEEIIALIQITKRKIVNRY